MRGLLALTVTFTLATTVAVAAIVEERFTLEVEVADRVGKFVRHPIVVTVFRDTTRAKAPFLILNHGRPTTAQEFVNLGRVRYTENSKYFVERGFVVLVPTRIGYGVSEGPDVENSGACASRDYPPVYEAAAQQVIATIRHAQKQSYVDAGRGLVVGQSFGGTTALAVAAKNFPGVVGAVNFAGGGGGRPATHPGDPCSEESLRKTFGSYGATARIPTLWLYAANDSYWYSPDDAAKGRNLPRAWFDEFSKNGGSGTFVQLPPLGDNGHPTFTRNPSAWKQYFEKFLSEIQMPPTRGR